MRGTRLSLNAVQGPYYGWRIPQVEYYTASLLYEIDRDVLPVRPLTFTGLVKGIGRNLVVMQYWRLMVTLRVLGFLSTPELGRLRWSDFTIRVWRYQMWRRLRIVRTARRLTTWR